jgi:hypothetical protein
VSSLFTAAIFTPRRNCRRCVFSDCALPPIDFCWYLHTYIFAFGSTGLAAGVHFSLHVTAAREWPGCGNGSTHPLYWLIFRSRAPPVLGQRRAAVSSRPLGQISSSHRVSISLFARDGMCSVNAKNQFHECTRSRISPRSCAHLTRVTIDL